MSTRSNDITIHAICVPVVVVYLAGQPVFVRDEAQRVLAPETAPLRAAVAIALAQAGALLAAQPDPASSHAVVARLLDQLALVGTAEAQEAAEQLRAGLDIQASAMSAATGILAAAIPTLPGTH